MREFTNRLIEMVEDGSFDPVDALRACLKYMSEDEVKDMCDMNEFTDYMFEPDEEDEDAEEDDVEEFDPHTEFEHVNDIWDLLEQCETLDQISDVLDEIPRKFGVWFYDVIDEGVIEVTNQWWDDNQEDMMVESQRFEVEE
jgi:hypothetical protein